MQAVTLLDGVFLGPPSHIFVTYPSHMKRVENAADLTRLFQDE